MSHIDTCLDKLIEAILESEEYSHYQKVRKLVKQDPEKEIAIDEFRKKVYELQNNRRDVDIFEEIDHMNQEAFLFRRDPVVDEYLEAELAMCRLVQRVNWKLMEKIDFDPIMRS